MDAQGTFVHHRATQPMWPAVMILSQHSWLAMIAQMISGMRRADRRRTHCRPSSRSLPRLSSRAALTPVTHDVGVQADLRSARGSDAPGSPTSRMQQIALQHARELSTDTTVHDELAKRAVKEVNVEARP